MTTIRMEGPGVTLINIFTVAPEDQRKLLDILTRATRDVIRRMPGFISANFHLSLDGTRVANYAQWKSKEDLDAMLRSPDARPHLDEALKIARPDAGLYKVAAIESHED